MGKYKIEKNIPLIRRRKDTPYKYPWDKMEVGDSFSFNKEEANAVSTSARHQNKKNKSQGSDKYFLSSYTHCRCWRVK